METNAWSIPGVYLFSYSKKSEIEISKGELLVLKENFFYVDGKKSVAIKCCKVEESCAPLFAVHYKLLKAIPKAKGRISVFATDG